MVLNVALRGHVIFKSLGHKDAHCFVTPKWKVAENSNFD